MKEEARLISSHQRRIARERSEREAWQILQQHGTLPEGTIDGKTASRVICRDNRPIGLLSLVICSGIWLTDIQGRGAYSDQDLSLGEGRELQLYIYFLNRSQRDNGQANIWICWSLCMYVCPSHFLLLLKTLYSWTYIF